MTTMKEHQAFGAPGNAPRWTSSAKEGIGTAYHTSSNVWFTLSHGIVNEVYFPHVDTPNTRDLQFLITDGETFCHEEKRDLLHKTERPEQNSLLYRITNSDPESRYRIVKEIIVDPHSSVLLMHTRVEILDPKLRGKLHVYALLAPHINGTGNNNSAWTCGSGGRKLIEMQNKDIDLSFGCSPDFLRHSVGFVGSSDGWRDLMDNFKMDWEFHCAENGNIAVMGEIDLSAGLEFTLGLGFGRTAHSACSHLQQSLATPFADQRARYVSQWQRACTSLDLNDCTGDQGELLRLSQCVLLAHEDKVFQGAFVASLSIPWGETKDDSDRGGYHLVWTRDMVQTATALMACGHTESPLRGLIWLACVQDDDGGLPQNSFIDGRPYWTGVQLDEVAAPILLAWRLREAKALRDFDPWPMVSRAARYLMLHGPVTSQERWEENSGYSPSTLATVIAALVCAAEFAKERKDKLTEKVLLEHADWISSHLEDWMVTTRGDLVENQPRHYLRITPADANDPTAVADPDGAEIQVANGGGTHPARRIIGGDFLHLVRLGVRPADDPDIVATVAVMDEVIRRDLPQGPGWRRYNFDGYGQKADGSAFDGTGEGRCWPILTGERAHFELAAGRDVSSFIHALESFANAGGMIPEQVWDAEDTADGRMKFGGPTGAAMPLCWSHAEYISLVRSRHDGKCFDRIEPVYQRYGVKRKSSDIELWTFAHQTTQILRGKSLRLLLEAETSVSWSTDGWVTTHELAATRIGSLDLWFVDFPMADHPDASKVEFTFFWKKTGQWEGKNKSVAIVSPKQPS